jgi:hypothetical protein
MGGTDNLPGFWLFSWRIHLKKGMGPTFWQTKRDDDPGVNVFFTNYFLFT